MVSKWLVYYLPGALCTGSEMGGVMKHKLSYLSLGVVLFLAAACFPQEDSCNIKTEGIYVEYEVVETASSAKAEAVFWVGNKPGGTNVRLTCGDVVLMNGVQLKKSGSNPARYKATVDVADTYAFVFDRKGESPYESTITNMPEPISLLSPKSVDIARDDAFDVTWKDNGTGDKLNLLIESECFWDYPDTLGKSVVDNGHHTVSADAFDLKSGKEAQTCSAKVVLTREAKGRLSPQLKGSIKGKTRASALFTSLPSADALAAAAADADAE